MSCTVNPMLFIAVINPYLATHILDTIHMHSYVPLQVTYADLHELPSTDSGNRQLPNPYPGYAELLM